MKKVLAMFLLLCVSIVAMAQDVIVKKDGSTILSKVIEVSSNEVKYKKHNNVNGPTYVVNVNELQSINYQNGEKESFGTNEMKQETVETPVFVPQGTRTMNDAELLKKYRYGNYEGVDLAKKIEKGKKLKKIGLIYGGSLVGAGVATMLLWKHEHIDHKGDVVGTRIGGSGYYIGLAVAGTGLIGGSYLLLSGNHMVKKYSKILSATAYQQEFKLGNNTFLTADVNVLNDEMTQKKALGLGFHLNF